MRNTVRSRLVTEQCHDEEVRPYIQQLMKTQSCSQVQTSEDTNSIDVAELNNEPCFFFKLEFIDYLHNKI